MYVQSPTTGHLCRLTRLQPNGGLISWSPGEIEEGPDRKRYEILKEELLLTLGGVPNECIMLGSDVFPPRWVQYPTSAVNSRPEDVNEDQVQDLWRDAVWVLS